MIGKAGETPEETRYRFLVKAKEELNAGADDGSAELEAANGHLGKAHDPRERYMRLKESVVDAMR